jgi:Fe-Mn family superoxide dismutase
MSSNKIINIIKKARTHNKSLSESYVVTYNKSNPKSFTVGEAPLRAHEELFKNYIEKLNAISAKIDSADKSQANSNHSEFRSLKIDETFNMNAAYLHSLYFANTGVPESSISIDSIAYLRLARDWGSFDSWQEDFIACAMSARNGWVVTVYNIFLQRYMNCVIDLHSENVPLGCVPVIAVDMWEHTYFKDFMTEKKKFLFKTMQEFNWEVIENRMKKTDALTKLFNSGANE